MGINMLFENVQIQSMTKKCQLNETQTMVYVKLQLYLRLRFPPSFPAAFCLREVERQNGILLAGKGKK